MMQKTVSKLSSALLLVAATAMPATTLAAGFQLTEQSVSGLGRAFAGGAAVAEDASTIFYNPAGLTMLDQQEIVAGASVITLKADFDKISATDAIGQPLTGGEGGDVGKLGAVPVGYYVRPINDKMVFGIGFNAPFGLSTDHPIDWVGRYQAVYSHVSSLNINPSLGWKANENWSLGFGLNLMHFRVKLSNMVDYGTVCFGRVDPLTCTALGLTPQSQDGYANVEGDSWGFGYNFGVMWHNDTTRIGFHYRSQVDQDLEGDASFTNAPSVFTANNVFVNTGISAEFTTPETISLALAHNINEDFMITADVVRTGWDTFEELRIQYDSAQPDTVEEEYWEDVYRYAIGLDWKYNDEWTFRTGYSLDQTPVQDEFRTPRLPDEDRNWLSFGATWKLSESSEIDFGYAHLFLDDEIPMDKTGSQGDTLIGTYEAAADIFGVEYRMKF
ncbi:MAG: outer membrane protein transport protein [Gammaproteobacteria bacterium]|nr:outer membrane protein transport protein [Gammaproteobacteria bacterium]